MKATLLAIGAAAITLAAGCAPAATAATPPSTPSPTPATQAVAKSAVDAFDACWGAAHERAGWVLCYRDMASTVVGVDPQLAADARSAASCIEAVSGRVVVWPCQGYQDTVELELGRDLR